VSIEAGEVHSAVKPALRDFVCASFARHGVHDVIVHIISTHQSAIKMECPAAYPYSAVSCVNQATTTLTRDGPEINL
jgi:hypothetical protein